MSVHAGFRAVEAYRAAIPPHQRRANSSRNIADLIVCQWNTAWIPGFTIAPTDDVTLAVHREGLCDVRALRGDAWSNERSVPGRMTCMPAEEESHFRVAGEVSFETIHIPQKRVQQVARSSGLDGCSTAFRFAFRDAFVDACFAAIYGEAHEPGPKSEEFIHSVTDSLILHLVRAVGPGTDTAKLRASAPVERSRVLIESSLAEDLSLEKLAEEAGVSRSHFARRFRAEVGVSPHRYHSQQRVEKAKLMLRQTNMSLVDIAMELGFCSQSHFTQVFRAHAGVTPRRFREME